MDKINNTMKLFINKQMHRNIINISGLITGCFFKGIFQLSLKVFS